MLFLIGIGFLGFATILLLRGATMNRVRTGESLAQIDGYGYVSHDVAERGARSPTCGSRSIKLAAALGRIVPTRFGGGARSIRRQLMTAGIYSITPSKFMGYRVLCMFVWVGGWILLGILGFHGGAVSVLGVLGLAFAGWLAPVRFVKAKGKRRKAQIENELPELIDLLVVTIEGRRGLHRLAAHGRRAPARPARRGAAAGPPGAADGPVHRRGAAEPARSLRHAVGSLVRPRRSSRERRSASRSARSCATSRSRCASADARRPRSARRRRR